MKILPPILLNLTMAAIFANRWKCSVREQVAYHSRTSINRLLRGLASGLQSGWYETAGLASNSKPLANGANQYYVFHSFRMKVAKKPRLSMLPCWRIHTKPSFWRCFICLPNTSIVRIDPLLFCTTSTRLSLIGFFLALDEAPGLWDRLNMPCVEMKYLRQSVMLYRFYVLWLKIRSGLK